MRDIKVGYGPIQEPIFDQEWAENMHEKSLNMLESLKGIEVVDTDDTITTEKDARNASEKFRKKDVDLVIIQTINADSSVLVQACSQKLDVPFLVWSTPEPTLTETTLRANSYCGSMIVTSALSKINRKYKHLHGDPGDKELQEELKSSIMTIGVTSVLQEGNIGLVGYRPEGFEHISFDEMLLRRIFGTGIHYIDTTDVLRKIEELTEKEIEDEVNEIKKDGQVEEEITAEDLNTTASISLSLNKIVEENNLKALAVKCVPEFMNELDQVPCTGISRVTNRGIMTACESDVIGALTMLVEHYLTGNNVFFVDLISMNEEENTGLVWHCGNAPVCMSENERDVKYKKHSIFSIGTTTEFACKPDGPVTFARITERENDYCLYAASGKAVEADPTLRGSSMRIKFDSPAEKIDKVLFENGVSNHFAVVYGDITDQLEEFSHWAGINSVML